MPDTIPKQKGQSIDPSLGANFKTRQPLYLFSNSM
jgi:hypothetical protein